MADRTPRDLFTEGHKRKFLVIVDESPEGETALVLRGPPRPADGRRLGASLCDRTARNVALARRRRYVSRRAASEGPCRVPSSRAETQELGFEEIAHEEIIREGYKAEEIVKLIEEDLDFGILVLGASTDTEGRVRLFPRSRQAPRPAHSLFRSPSSPEISRSKTSKD